MRKHPRFSHPRLFAFVDGSATALMQLLLGVSTSRTLKRIINCPTYPMPVATDEWKATVRELSASLGESSLMSSQLLATLYASARSSKYRKKQGQFFTDDEAAAWAINQAALGPSDDVLDAGAGTGVFAESILRQKIEVQSYTGIENDALLALTSAIVLDRTGAPATFRIAYSNFLTLSRERLAGMGLPSPSVVVGNPPFIRALNLRGRANAARLLKDATGIRIPALSGSTNFFVLRAVDLVGGRDEMSHRRIVLFFPREALGSIHAGLLRTELRQHGWDSASVDVPQSNRAYDREGARSLGRLFVFTSLPGGSVAVSHNRSEAVTLGYLLSVHRGISTGCNEYFVLTDKEVRRRGLPEDHLRRVVPTKIHLPDGEFTRGHWDALACSGRPCWLLALPNLPIQSFEESVREYLREGLRRGLNMTPTAQRLRSWYSISLPRSAPDLFVTYLFRGAPRFILNPDGILNLTNILGASFRYRVSNTNRPKLVNALNEQAKRWSVDGVLVREYRDGLRKVEPRELLGLTIDSQFLSNVEMALPINRSLF